MKNSFRKINLTIKFHLKGIKLKIFIKRDSSKNLKIFFYKTFHRILIKVLNIEYPKCKFQLFREQKIQNIKISNINPQILISLSHIEEIRIGKYLEIDKNILWVTPEFWETMNVYSSTHWNVI